MFDWSRSRGPLAGIYRVRAVGRNGIEVGAEANQVFTLEPDGPVSRVEMYQELEEAMAATRD